MKIFKTRILILISVLFALNLAHSQEDQPTMFVVHTDNVKFDMIPKYEQMALKLKNSCEENNIKDASWTAISVEDGRYVYVSPISSMADLDKDPMEGLAEKMGEEKMGKMFEEMDQCYDSHSNAIVHFKPNLSYMPEGYTTQDKNRREYHFIYYSPKNSKKMKEAMAKVKDMFKAKGIKNGYEVYHSGFGSDDNYYMVSVAGKNNLEIAKGGEDNDKLMGEEGEATMFNVIKLASNYEKFGANIRPDLSYNPK